jgi:hypothetical protein
LAHGWLAYARFIAEDMGLIVIDREFYLEIPELDIHVRLSTRTNYPVFYIRDDDDLSDIVCYYNRRYRRYVCLHRRLVEGVTIVNYQAHYTMIFERCYKERGERGASRTNNLHVECHTTREFTTREINEYIRDSKLRGLRSLESILDFFAKLREDLDKCCYYECYSENFKNADALVELADIGLSYHSRNRYSTECYMDRCNEVGKKYFSIVCTE